MAINWMAKPGGDAMRPVVRTLPGFGRANPGAQARPGVDPAAGPAPGANPQTPIVQHGPSRAGPGVGAQIPGGTHPVTKNITVTPPPPDMSGDKWRGYLTPDQAGALNTAFDTHGYNVGVQQRNIADAQETTTSAIQAAQLQHDQNTNLANQELAARGMFQSSVRDNDLADLDAAFVQRQDALSTNFQTLQTNALANIDWLNKTYNDTLGNAQGNAAIQAMQLPVNLPHPGTQTTQVPNTLPGGTRTPINSRPPQRPGIAAGYVQSRAQQGVGWAQGLDRNQSVSGNRGKGVSQNFVGHAAAGGAGWAQKLQRNSKVK